MIATYHHTPHKQNQHDNERRMQARIAGQTSSDITTNKRASLPTAAPVAVRWRKMVAQKLRSQSSSDVEARLLACQDDHTAQKHDTILGESTWPAYTTQTSVSVCAKARYPQIAAAGIHRRLCFSLDEKALFDLHHPQYSSTASKQQTSSEQSPQRTAMGPIKPPFAPPERVRTPDGVPSWPGVNWGCPHAHEHEHEGARAPRRGLREEWSRMVSRFLKHHRSNRMGKEKGRIRRALSFNRRPRQEARTIAQWRPPISGHSTFRFDD